MRLVRCDTATRAQLLEYRHYFYGVCAKPGLLALLDKPVAAEHVRFLDTLGMPAPGGMAPAGNGRQGASGVF